MKTILALIIAASMTACNTPMTPAQQAALTKAEVGGIAALNTVLEAYAKGQKVDSKVAAQAAQAALAASTAATTL